MSVFWHVHITTSLDQGLFLHTLFENSVLYYSTGSQSKKMASWFSLERNWLLPEPNRVTARCEQPVGAIVVTPKISIIPEH